MPTLFQKPLELVISDVDGVILDLNAHMRANFENAARRLALPEGPICAYLADCARGVEVYRSTLEQTAEFLWPWTSHREQIAYAQCFQEEERKRPYPPVPGSVNALNWFRDRGVMVALCTTNDSRALTSRFEAIGVPLDMFSAISMREDGRPLKPDPRTLDVVFERTGVPREHAVYVGDWYPDLYAAQGAGVRFIAALSGGIPRDAFVQRGVPEDHIIPRLEHLMTLVA